MIILEYSSHNFSTISLLHQSQNSQLSQILKPADLPAIGFITYDDSTPIAAGFLRIVEGGFAMIDTLVTNGDCSSIQRNDALVLLVGKLIETARNLNLKGIISHTIDTGVLSRAKSLGFKETDQKVLSLVLN